MKEHSSSVTDNNDGKHGATGIPRWIGVDLDGTLVHYTTWNKQGTAIGEPVPAMVQRIKRWLANGQEVKIFTARACDANWHRTEDFAAIDDFCMRYFDRKLEITNIKDFAMCELWDDRAITVEKNTGYRSARSADMALWEGDPLDAIEEIELVGEGDPAIDYGKGVPKCMVGLDDGTQYETLVESLRRQLSQMETETAALHKRIEDMEEEIRDMHHDAMDAAARQAE